MSLADRKILIAGGTRGIGRAVAEGALAARAEVIVTARSADRLSGLPPGLRGSVLDYTDSDSVRALAASLGTLDHLVLSASFDLAWGSFCDVSEEALRRAFEGKFWGYWRMIHAFAPRMAPGGSITLVTGAAARAAVPGTAGLAAVNGALEAMAKVLAAELAPLRVNSISPGITATEAYAGMPGAARQAMFAAAAAKLPAGRIGEAADIADAILMAAANPFLTGATIDIDGGLHLPR